VIGDAGQGHDLAAVRLGPAADQEAVVRHAADHALTFGDPMHDLIAQVPVQVWASFQESTRIRVGSQDHSGEDFQRLAGGVLRHVAEIECHTHRGHGVQ
jgi:hypothetical protein